MVFSLSALWWKRIRNLWKLPDGRDWLRMKLGLVLMGWAMLSKSLIQFSVEGWGVFPPYYLTWGQTMVEVTKIMATSFKKFHAHIATLSAPNSAAGHRWPTPPPKTPGHSRANLGQSLVESLLLSLGSWYVQGSLCAFQESVSPVLCKFWWLYRGLIVTSSKRAYAISRSTAPRTPSPTAIHC